MENKDQLPVVQAQVAYMPVEMSVMVDRLEYIEQFVQKIMVKDTDYGTVPGAKRPSLFKPGAEKLQFAFNLESTYKPVTEIFEPLREWQYEKVDKNTGVITQHSVKGFFRHEVRCTLTNRSTGEKWGSAIGECDSTERGRETAPSNTILKMAQKRAHVGAVLNATFTSDRFTQDVEDLRGNQALAERPVSDQTHGEPDDGFPSNKDKTQKCGFCGEWHIEKGNIITKTGKQREWQGKMFDEYGAVACRDKQSPTDNSNQGGSETGRLQLRLLDLEELWIKTGVAANGEEMNRTRMQHGGSLDPLKMSNAGMKNYIEFLEGLGLEI